MNLKELSKRLAESKFVTNPQLEARWILEKFSEQDSTVFEDIIRRRLKAEPLAYILQEKEFYGLNFFVDHRVLVPRPETEILADIAIEYMKNHHEAQSILDLGSGSGCLGLSVLKKSGEKNLTSVDISSEALEVTRMNAQALGLVDQTQFICSKAEDFLQKTEAQFDLILGNPPYVVEDTAFQDKEALSYEPAIALYAANEGLACIESWLHHAVSKLSKQSLLAFEIGFDQGQKVKNLFADTGEFVSTLVVKDLSQNDRFVLGLKGKSWTPSLYTVVKS